MRLPAFAALFVTFVAWPGSGFRDRLQSEGAQRETKVHLRFDRNEYPGDAAMPVLRKSFAFSGYWLTPPPNTPQNTWEGKRKILEELGFGFLLLARGRAASTVQANAQENGIADAREAAKNAKQEGFAVGSVVFLDVEEGGRLPPQFRAYFSSWIDEVARLGFRPGVYCSGMPVNDGMAAKFSAPMTSGRIWASEGLCFGCLTTFALRLADVRRRTCPALRTVECNMQPCGSLCDHVFSRGS